MALFGSKKKTEEKKAASKAAPKKEKAVATVSPTKTAVGGVKDVLLRPRVTEKAANMTADNVYTFDIRQSATKKDVAEAVKKLYKVHPVKVTVVNTPAKRVRMRTRRGFGKTNAGRKAYVFLKKGEQINLGN
jgi:large subunit ribosomal protein L23